MTVKGKEMGQCRSTRETTNGDKDENPNHIYPHTKENHRYPMNTHITNPRQFRLYGAVLAMAALLAVLLAVTLTAGPTMTQADEGKGQGPRLGDNAQEYRQYGVLPCTEETQPAASDAAIISDGYYAVFDGFWDYEDGHLSNNFCPQR